LAIFSGFDGAEIFCVSGEEFRGIDGGGLQSGEWSHAGIDHHGEFIVQAEAREAEGIHGVGSRHYWRASAKHGAEDVLVSGKKYCEQTDIASCSRCGAAAGCVPASVRGIFCQCRRGQARK